MSARHYRKIQSIDDCEVLLNVDLAEHNSMRIGGKTACMAIPHTEKALEELIKRVHRLKIPMFALGGGTNTVFMDDGFDGIVLKLGRDFQHIRNTSGVRFTAGAGAELKQLVVMSTNRNAAGLEYCFGIPGTIGGALAGNAGTRGVGVCDRVAKVWGYTKEGERYEVEKFPYGYRHSWLRSTYIVGANFTLDPCDTEEKKLMLKERIKLFSFARRSQPYRKPSAGCIFKNPQNDSAGRLIDVAGLKGFSVGDVEVSDRHANFIVNNGKGRAEDLVYLICYIRQQIKEKYDVDLQLEVQLISSHPMLVGPDGVRAAEGSRLRATVLEPSATEPILSFL